MDIISLCGLALVASILAVLIGQYKPEYRIFITVVAIGAVIIFFLTYIEPLKNTVEELLNSSQASQSLIKILYKCLAVTYITGITSDICNDAGEHALASNVELSGKIAVVYVALPLITETIKIIGKLTSL